MPINLSEMLKHIRVPLKTDKVVKLAERGETVYAKFKQTCRWSAKDFSACKVDGNTTRILLTRALPKRASAEYL
jgi:hypothetical protein